MTLTEEVIWPAQLALQLREGGRGGGREGGRKGEGEREKGQPKSDQVHLVYGRDVTSRELELWAG